MYILLYTTVMEWLNNSIDGALNAVADATKYLVDVISASTEHVFFLVVLVILGVMMGDTCLRRPYPRTGGHDGVIRGGRMNNRKRPNNRQRTGVSGNRDRVKDLSKHPRTKSEAFAIDLLEKLVGVSFPTVNPDWLRVSEGGYNHTIELDGYNADAGIALEFSGPLHTKWTPATEPYAAYLRRVMLDRAKIDLCKKQGVCLIVIDMSLGRMHWRNYIASRLKDCEKLPTDRTVYFQYIPDQPAVPYRDDILERDIKLDITW